MPVTDITIETILVDLHHEFSAILHSISLPEEHAWLYQSTSTHMTITELAGDYDPHHLCIETLQAGATCCATVSLVDGFAPCLIAYITTNDCFDLRRAPIYMSAAGLQLRSWECML